MIALVAPHPYRPEKSCAWQCHIIIFLERFLFSQTIKHPYPSCTSIFKKSSKVQSKNKCRYLNRTDLCLYPESARAAAARPRRRRQSLLPRPTGVLSTSLKAKQIIYYGFFLHQLERLFVYKCKTFYQL